MKPLQMCQQIESNVYGKDILFIHTELDLMWLYLSTCDKKRPYIYSI